ESLKAPVVKDTAGAGDWCTAGLLHQIAQDGAAGLLRLTPEDLESALRFGQALAAWNCGFVGARGGMEQATLDEGLSDVVRILRGRESETLAGERNRLPPTDVVSWCPACIDLQGLPYERPKGVEAIVRQ